MKQGVCGERVRQVSLRVSHECGGRWQEVILKRRAGVTVECQLITANRSNSYAQIGDFKVLS
jgi:hypothetical protein